MKVLVTGATGFIGNHVARMCLEQGDDVRVMVMPGEEKLPDAMRGASQKLASALRIIIAHKSGVGADQAEKAHLVPEPGQRGGHVHRRARITPVLRRDRVDGPRGHHHRHRGAAQAALQAGGCGEPGGDERDARRLGEEVVGAGAKPFIEVGSKVSAGQTLLIIEAMKTMNQIPSPPPVTGVVIAVAI